MIAVARTADVVIMMLDATKGEAQRSVAEPARLPARGPGGGGGTVAAVPQWPRGLWPYHPWEQRQDGAQAEPRTGGRGPHP